MPSQAWFVPFLFSSDALRFCAILIERKENGQFKPSRRLHEAKQSAVRRSRAIISPLIAVAYLHLYTQHYISISAKRQAFFPSGERIPRFYPNRGFQAKGLVNYHEKKYPDLETLSKYPFFFSSFLNRRGAGAQWRYRSGGKIGWYWTPIKIFKKDFNCLKGMEFIWDSFCDFFPYKSQNRQRR